MAGRGGIVIGIDDKQLEVGVVRNVNANVIVQPVVLVGALSEGDLLKLLYLFFEHFEYLYGEQTSIIGFVH